MEASVKCEKCGRPAWLRHRQVVYAQVQLPKAGPVKVPGAVALKIDCPQCGQYLHFKDLKKCR